MKEKRRKVNTSEDDPTPGEKDEEIIKIHLGQWRKQEAKYICRKRDVMDKTK